MKQAGSLGMYLGGLGKIIGNSEDLPEDTQVLNYRKGQGGYWGDVYLYGTKIGYLKPGGQKGIFVREAPNPPAPVSTAVPATPISAPAPPALVEQAAIPYARPPEIYTPAPAPAPAPVPVMIPTVQTPSSIAPTPAAVSTLVESSSSPPAVLPTDTAPTDTTGGNQWLGIAALLAGGWALAKLLGFKSRL